MDDARALIVSGPGSLAVGSRPTAAPRPHEAVVGVAYGGICGSDVHYWKDGQVGGFILRSPMILGHEVVGVVAEPAADGSGPARGTRVAIHPAQVCGECDHCRRGAQNLCADLRYLGSAARVPHTDGGFADRLVVSADRLIPIPEELDMRTAALAEPASIALHGLRQVDRLGHGLGHRVEGGDILVVGAGPIGLLAIALAAASGARTITATDLFDRPLGLARQAGATHVVRADTDAPITETHIPDAPIRDAPIADGDVAIAIAIESSGSPHGLGTALAALRPGGILVSVGHLPAGGVTAPLHLAVTRELTLTGSSRFYHEMPAALSIMSRHVERFAPIVTSVFPLNDAEPAFQEAADAERSSKVLLSFAPEADSSPRR